MEQNTETDNTHRAVADKRLGQDGRKRDEQMAGTHETHRPVTVLLKELSQEFTTLVSKEAALARAEIREKAQQFNNGAVELGSGVILAFLGLVFLLQAGVYALAPVVNSLWLASLIIGSVVLILGLAVLAAGRSNLKTKNLTPDRTAHSVKQDGRMLQERGRREGERMNNEVHTVRG